MAARPGRREPGELRSPRASTDSRRPSGSYLDDYWAVADVELEGDPEIQQALRFALFNVLQASARAETRAIAAKGLTGPGYDGHAFWDTESLRAADPHLHAAELARDALIWRHTTLDLARERARELGLRGAAFPWRTIHGEECSGYWPAGTAAFHVNADVADAVRRYVLATGDEDFERDFGAELLVETARLWMSLGNHEPRGPLPHRRRDGARRVLGAGGQQRLHEPHGTGEPARGRGRRRAPPGLRAAGWRWTKARSRHGGMRRTDVRPLRRAARRPPAGPGLHRPRALGLRGNAAGGLPAAPPPPVPRPLPQAGGQAGGPRACALHCAATPSPRRRSGATSSTTRRSRCATRRCPRASNPWWPPRSATSTWPMTISRKPR